MSGPSDKRIQARLRLRHADFQLDVDLDLAGRGVTALFGPSGSGKTSCLRAIAGLERSAQGCVTVNDEVWQDDTLLIYLPVHRRALGYVFQDANLFGHLSVAQNLAFGLKRTPPAQRRIELEQVLDLLGIAHLLQRAPQTLSGGERSRVAIARALATSPRLLLLDEPLAALDAQRKAEILPYLERLARKLDVAILYVSHAIDEVTRLADHMVLLEDGRVAASGATETLLTRLDLPLAHGDGASAVLTSTVLSHDAHDHLSCLRFEGGLLYVPMQAAAIGERLRLRIAARDVSLTLQRQSGTSILNILDVTVRGLCNDSPGQVMVALDAAGASLLARVTTRSAHTLGLASGLTLYAQIKGVAILN